MGRIKERIMKNNRKGNRKNNRKSNRAPTAEVNPQGLALAPIQRSGAQDCKIRSPNTGVSYGSLMDFLQPYGAVSFLSFQLTASGGIDYNPTIREK